MPPRVWKVRYLRLVRKVHRILRHRRLRHREWWKPIAKRLLDRRLWHPCRDTVAGGISIGLFFSMMPMPMQTIFATAIATRARVNIPFTVASCFVTNPLTEPFIRIAQLRFGAWMREYLGLAVPKIGDLSLAPPVSNFIMGFLVMGILMSLISYPIVHLFSALLPHHLPIRAPKFRASRSESKNQSSAN